MPSHFLIKETHVHWSKHLGQPSTSNMIGCSGTHMTLFTNIGGQEMTITPNKHLQIIHLIPAFCVQTKHVLKTLTCKMSMNSKDNMCFHCI